MSVALPTSTFNDLISYVGSTSSAFAPLSAIRVEDFVADLEQPAKPSSQLETPSHAELRVIDLDGWAAFPALRVGPEQLPAVPARSPERRSLSRIASGLRLITFHIYNVGTPNPPSSPRICTW
jgi:hypothetical protein